MIKTRRESHYGTIERNLFRGDISWEKYFWYSLDMAHHFEIYVLRTRRVLLLFHLLQYDVIFIYIWLYTLWKRSVMYFFSMYISLVWLVNLYYITDRVYIMVDWNDANATKFLLFLYCDVKKRRMVIIQHIVK